MRRGLAIAGGLVGAIFTGASAWAFTAVHIETVYVYNIPIQKTVTGYPELGALFLMFAIIGFVIMAVGFLSRPSDLRSSQPIPQAPTYACPYCGQVFGQGTLVCPRCNHEIKW